MISDQKPVGPVTAAIRAMRSEEIKSALADIGDLAADASNSVIAAMGAAQEGRLDQALHEGVAAASELQVLLVYVQRVVFQLEAEPI